MANFIDRLAGFAAGLRFEDLPKDLVHESKRVLLDSIGCALAAAECAKGRSAIKIARRLGGPQESSILGLGEKVSCFGAAFANGELMNALDYNPLLDAHISPYVVPPSLALGEASGVSGKAMILSCAIGNEVSTRLKSGLNLSIFAARNGLSHNVIAGTLAAARMLNFDQKKIANAVGLAVNLAPIPTFTKWTTTSHSALTKYGSPGWIAGAQVMALLSAEMGNSGDATAFDEPHALWRSFAEDGKWDPEIVMNGLGQTWIFPQRQDYKFYPCCGILLTPLDCFKDLIEKNNLKPDEIDSVNVWCHPFVEIPLCQSKVVRSHVDAQFSVAYVFACAAHKIKAGAEWQAERTMNNPEIIKFMSKVNSTTHPRFDEERRKDPNSRIGSVELVARGKVFKDEKLYPKGFNATDSDLIEKFKDNVSPVLSPSATDKAIATVLNLESVDNISKLFSQFARARELV